MPLQVPVVAVIGPLSLAGPSELQELWVQKVSGYCWKISGDTAMMSAVHVRLLEEAMVKGQGRWGLYAKKPDKMTHYYRHSPLGEKLDTTDFPWPLPSSKQQ